MDQITQVAGDPYLDVILEAGDTLVVPRGWYYATYGHSGKTGSLHLAMGLRTEADDLIWSTFIMAAMGRLHCPTPDSTDACKKLQPVLHNFAFVVSLRHVSLREALPWPILQTGSVRTLEAKAHQVWKELVTHATTTLQQQAWRWQAHESVLKTILGLADSSSEEKVMGAMEAVLKERKSLHAAKQRQLWQFMNTSRAMMSNNSSGRH